MNEGLSPLQRMLQRAIVQGRRAGARGDAPHGAVLVDPFGTFVHAAADTTKSSFDPTAHAEMNLLREAAAKERRLSFEGFAVVCSHEPCTACASALMSAQISAIFYGESSVHRPDPQFSLTELARRCEEQVHIEGGLSLPKEEVA